MEVHDHQSILWALVSALDDYGRERFVRVVCFIFGLSNPSTKRHAGLVLAVQSPSVKATNVSMVLGSL